MSFAHPHLVPSHQRLVIVLLLAIIASGCVKRNFTQPGNLARSSSASNQQTPNSRINVNTASAAELEQLPGIGKALAARIIEHRQKFGPFRRAEHLIMVRGISDQRFRALQALITVE